MDHDVRASDIGDRESGKCVIGLAKTDAFRNDKKGVCGRKAC